MQCSSSRRQNVSVNTLTVLVAQYLLYVLALVAVLVWLTLGRRDKLVLAGQTVLGLALVLIGIKVAGSLHTDPRPFVQAHVQPLFAHVADNGFPSDHSAAGALLATLIFAYRRRIGVLIGVGAVLIGSARVIAKVHHVQDIAAGLLIGVLAALLSVWVIGRVAPLIERRLVERRGAAVRRSSIRS